MTITVISFLPGVLSPRYGGNYFFPLASFSIFAVRPTQAFYIALVHFTWNKKRCGAGSYGTEESFGRHDGLQDRGATSNPRAQRGGTAVGHSILSKMNRPNFKSVDGLDDAYVEP